MRESCESGRLMHSSEIGDSGRASRPGEVFFRQQIRCLEAGDMDGLMGQYHEDAVLLTFGAVVRGRVAIGEFLRDYLGHLGAFTLRSTDRFVDSGDAVFVEATVLSDLGEARVYDAFVLRDGKATHHFAGVIASANRSQANTVAHSSA